MKKILAYLLIGVCVTLGFSYIMYAKQLDEKTLKFLEPYFRSLTGLV